MRAGRRRPPDPGRCSPARRTRATTAASGSCRTCSRIKHAPGFADRVVFLDDYDLRMARLARARLRRVDQPPAPAAGGVAARRGMKYVVNGGLQLSVLDGWWAEGYDGAQRLGAVRRRRPRPRRPGRAPRRRALPPARGGGRARVLRRRRATASRATGSRACAARCARSARSSAPGGCSRTTRRRSTRPGSKAGSRSWASPSETPRPWSSARRVAVGAGVGSVVGVGVGVSVGNGVGVGIASPAPVAGIRASSSFLTSVAEPVQARVELLVDLFDAVVDAVLEDAARR